MTDRRTRIRRMAAALGLALLVGGAATACQPATVQPAPTTTRALASCTQGAHGPEARVTVQTVATGEVKLLHPDGTLLGYAAPAGPGSVRLDLMTGADGWPVHPSTLAPITEVHVQVLYPQGAQVLIRLALVRCQ